jgi:hypothetical protein
MAPAIRMTGYHTQQEGKTPGWWDRYKKIASRVIFLCFQWGGNGWRFLYYKIRGNEKH